MESQSADIAIGQKDPIRGDGHGCAATNATHFGMGEQFSGSTEQDFNEEGLLDQTRSNFMYGWTLTRQGVGEVDLGRAEECLERIQVFVDLNLQVTPGKMKALRVISTQLEKNWLEKWWEEFGFFALSGLSRFRL
ncbi:MAG: hypothetical protein EZS28_049850 [Streblomastix strix]|uniref:Uncharacterized protein n=1 Tax=Streblomastix strix TaxID=222440 RepID=A0A5J4T8B7_9EUKA|nr:MAG: hypothetical protein EZS28_049850 [Streblomastix strix]